jgi:CBS domain-containing protein
MEITGTVDTVLKAKGSAVWSVAPDLTVFEAIKVLADKNVGALLVMDGETLVGVFSERDYTRKVALAGKNSKTTRVREIITGKIVTVSLRSTVEECLRLMTDQRVRHLPVLEQNRVVGILSIGDLVNWIITAQRAAISQLQDYIAGSYVGSSV